MTKYFTVNKICEAMQAKDFCTLGTVDPALFPLMPHNDRLYPTHSAKQRANTNPAIVPARLYEVIIYISTVQYGNGTEKSSGSADDFG